MHPTRLRSAAFYISCAVVLVILVTKTQQHFLPAGLATQIGHNSEAFLFAPLVAAQIQILRRVAPGPGRLVGMVVGALALIGAGELLLHSSLQPTLVTLNEPLIGAGFVLIYLTLPRSPVTGIAVTLATVLFIIVFFDTSFVLDQAESLVPLALAGLALDVFDPSILQPEREDTPGLRLVWIGLLVLALVGFHVGADWARPDLHGSVRYGLDYAQRAEEAYWGWLLVHLFFSYWLGPRWRTPLATSRVDADQGQG